MTKALNEFLIGLLKDGYSVTLDEEDNFFTMIAGRKSLCAGRTVYVSAFNIIGNDDCISFAALISNCHGVEETRTSSVCKCPEVQRSELMEFITNN